MIVISASCLRIKESPDFPFYNDNEMFIGTFLEWYYKVSKDVYSGLKRLYFGSFRTVTEAIWFKVFKFNECFGKHNPISLKKYGKFV